MKLGIFCVHDSKAGAHISPFFLPNEAMALRTFTDCVNSDSHQFGANPADYTLFSLGEFCQEKAEFFCEKRSLANGIEVKSQADMFADMSFKGMPKNDGKFFANRKEDGE